MSHRWMKAASCVVVVGALGLTACSDNKPSKSDQAFCDGLIAFDKVSTPGGPSDKSEADQAKEYGAGITAPFATLKANAPSDLTKQLATMDTALAKLKTGDAKAIEDDSANQAKKDLESWAFDNCDFHTVSAVARDYGYSGLPSSIKTGKTAIKLKDEGNEPHIMLWLKRADGDTRPAPDVIDAAFAKGTFEGFIDGEPAGAGPHGSGGITMQAQPAGKYIVFCPIGVKGQENDPHYKHGMHAEVEIKS